MEFEGKKGRSESGNAELSSNGGNENNHHDIRNLPQRKFILVESLTSKIGKKQLHRHHVSDGSDLKTSVAKVMVDIMKVVELYSSIGDLARAMDMQAAMGVPIRKEPEGDADGSDTSDQQENDQKQDDQQSSDDYLYISKILGFDDPFYSYRE